MDHDDSAIRRLKRLLRRVRRWRFLNALLLSLIWVAAAASAVACVGEVVSVLAGRFPGLVAVAPQVRLFGALWWFLVGLVAVGAAVRIGLGFPSLLAVARDLDHRLRTHELWSTALEVSRAERNPITTLLLANAAREADRFGSRKLVVWRTPRVVLFLPLMWWATFQISMLPQPVSAVNAPLKTPSLEEQVETAMSDTPLFAARLSALAEDLLEIAEREEDDFLLALAQSLESVAREVVAGERTSSEVAFELERLIEMVAVVYGVDPGERGDLATFLPSDVALESGERPFQGNYERPRDAARGFREERDPGEEDFTFQGNADVDTGRDEHFTDEEIAERDQQNDNSADRDTAETSRADQRRQTTDFADDPYDNDAAVSANLERIMTDAPAAGAVALVGEGGDAQAGMSVADLFGEAATAWTWLEDEGAVLELAADEATARRIRIDVPPRVQRSDVRDSVGVVSAWERGSEAVIPSVVVAETNRTIASAYFAAVARERSLPQ